MSPKMRSYVSNSSFFVDRANDQSHELRNEVVEERISDQVSENRGELDIEIRRDERNRGRTNEKGKRGEEWRTIWEKRPVLAT